MYLCIFVFKNMHRLRKINLSKYIKNRKDYDLSRKDIIVAASNAGWIGHCFSDYKTLLPNSNIKGELDLLFSANAGERDKMLTTQKEVDEWVEKL